MKKLLASSLLLGSVLMAEDLATDNKLHLGVTLSHDTNTIVVGYDPEDLLRIEGFLSHVEQEVDDTFMVGAGLFARNKTSNESHIYYGGRLAYIDYGIDDGIALVPTFGFEYMFNQHVSIGGEAGYQIGTSDISNQTITNATLHYYF